MKFPAAPTSLKPRPHKPQLDLDRPEAHLLATLFATLSAFWLPLSYSHISPGRDWRYFDSLGQLVRALVGYYHSWPLHDPWRCGGLDVLANPQSRLLSPLALLDIFFTPHLANVLSLVFWGGVGFLGMTVWLRQKRLPIEYAWAGAFLWLHNSFFALHFAEGQIPFGPFQALPWLLVAIKHLDKPSHFAAAGCLFTAWIIDGAPYPVVYGLLIIVATTLGGGIPWRGTWQMIRRRPTTSMLWVVGCGLVAASKAIPTLIYMANNPGHPNEAEILGPEAWYSMYLSLDHSIYQDAVGHFGFHEHGCHIGMLAMAVVAVRSFDTAFLRAQGRSFMAVGVAFWLATGIGGAFNPWRILRQIPLINVAHVPARFNLLVLLFGIPIVMAALQPRSKAQQNHKPAQARFAWNIPRYVYSFALIALVCEFFWVHQSIWFDTFFSPKARAFSAEVHNAPITHSRWQYTGPNHRYRLPYESGLGSGGCYEPSRPQKIVPFPGLEDYQGEIFIEDLDRAKTRSVELLTVRPGEMTFTYRGEGPARIGINQHWLLGWQSEGDGRNNATPYDRGEGMLGVHMAGPGKATLRYTPIYWPYTPIGWILGIAMIIVAMVQQRRRRS